MQWQPIETAPRDGTHILVMYIHVSTQCVFNALWIDHAEGWNDPEDEGWWSYVYSEVGRSMLNGYRTPTYWMPLPQPPKESK